MAYEVFVSYSRRDRELCDQVMSLIAGQMRYLTFRDVDDLEAGGRWKAQLDAALNQRRIQPVVVVLCTRSAVDNPAEIISELKLAVERSLIVVPIEFQVGAAEFLLGQAGFAHPENLEQIKALDADGKERTVAWLEDHLRRALTAHVAKWLKGRRDKAEKWAEPHLRTPSFWASRWQDYFSFDGPHGLPVPVALIAKGGSGKSSLLAHCVDHLLKNHPDVYPVIVDEDLLRSASSKLPDLLGARDKDMLLRQVEALGAEPPPNRFGRKPMRPVFVVDGLDQMVVPGDPGHRQLAAGLNFIIDIAPVLIGCRQEVWEIYAPRIGVKSILVPQLEQTLVVGLLQKAGLPASEVNPLLRVPLFLDIVLNRADHDRNIAITSATGFLQRVWSDAVRGRRTANSGSSGRKWILEAIADRQLAALQYDVPLDLVKKSRGFVDAYEAGFSELLDDRILVQRKRSDGTVLVRLRHDLLDTYSMLRALLLGGAGTVQEPIRALAARCDEDCGWSLLAMLAQHAHDGQNDDLKRLLFEEFLFVIDRKKFGDEPMARAWAVTYALRSSFPSVYDLIVEAIGGERADSLDWRDPAQAVVRRSTLGPPARLTQEAASTLAAAFMGLEHGRLQDAGKVVPALANGLRTWHLRARFVEALAKFPTPEALKIIIDFAEQRLASRDDCEVLTYVAQSLRHYIDEPAALSLLRRLAKVTIEDGGNPDGASLLTARIRRAAAQSLNHLCPGEITVPLPTDAEIIAGLAIHGSDGKTYTDWQEVELYAEFVRDRRAEGEEFGPGVLSALIAALEHAQSYARAAVASALAYFDEGDARDALLAELQKTSIRFDVRDACLAALHKQAERLADPAALRGLLDLLRGAHGAAGLAGANQVEEGIAHLMSRVSGLAKKMRDGLFDDLLVSSLPPQKRQACLVKVQTFLHASSDLGERRIVRFLVLRLAGVALARGDDALRNELLGLALNPAFLRAGDGIATAGAIEATAARIIEECQCVRTAEAVDLEVGRELAELGPIDVGPDHERKFRFTELRSADGILIAELAETTWREGRGFHAALLDAPRRFLHVSGGWLVPRPLGPVCLPGLAVVHGILLTGDGRVLMAQRSAKLAYAPLHWSASFEEQITEADFAGGENALASSAARRGLREEFGVEGDPARTHVIATLLQMDNLNLGLVVLVETDEPFEEIRRRVETGSSSHAWETGKIGSIAATPDSLRELCAAGVWELGPLHPTSGFRLAALARWLDQH